MEQGKKHSVNSGQQIKAYYVISTWNAVSKLHSKKNVILGMLSTYQ